MESGDQVGYEREWANKIDVQGRLKWTKLVWGPTGQPPVRGKMAVK